jgi:CDP-glucose 4,6-dehydratase
VEVSGFWRDRPTFVTGGTGLIGGWLVRKLIAEGAGGVCLVRDWVPPSALFNESLHRSVKVVRGDLRDQELLERALGEYEIDTVINLARRRSSRSRIGIRRRRSRRTWPVPGGCSKPAGTARRSSRS